MNLGGWLRKTPQPHTIVADGKKIEVGHKGGKWRDLVRTIESLNATKIECLDSAGNIIRATTIDEDETDDKAKTEPKSDIQVFAGLIAEAYEKGSKSYSPLLTSAMEFVQAQGQRLAKAEAEIERLRAANAKLRAEILAAAQQTPGGVEEDSMLGMFLASMAQGQAAQTAQEPPANVAPIKKGVPK